VVLDRQQAAIASEEAIRRKCARIWRGLTPVLPAPPQEPDEDADESVRAEYEDALEAYSAAVEAESEAPPEAILTAELFAQLEPFLAAPTPAVFIEFTPMATERNERGYLMGLAYDTLGLKSVQFQYDRMNNVLGSNHWRPLLHYAQGGILTKAVVVIGNHLDRCRLDAEGQLVTWRVLGPLDHDKVEPVLEYAEVLAVREGWGGFKMNAVGDTFKAGETNTLKRVLARFGPGNDVMRVDYDSDSLAAALGQEQESSTFSAAMEAQAARAAQPRATSTRGETPATAAAEAEYSPELIPGQGPQPGQGEQPGQRDAAPAQRQGPPPAPTEERAEELLDELVNRETEEIEVDGVKTSLQALRRAANDAMMAIEPEDMRPRASQRWTLISQRADDPRELTALVERARSATKKT
jgi:hypothetical protein